MVLDLFLFPLALYSRRWRTGVYNEPLRACGNE
jgi:hypothetical protein